jgi:hypothetical protein
VNNDVTTTIPEQRPIGDGFTGKVIQLGGVYVLGTAALPEGEVVAEGSFVIRYGVRYAGKLQVSIVPGLVVMDYGDMLTGEEAWNFLVNRSNLYPRSEVVGYCNDGSEDMVFIRALDMAVAPEVLVFADDKAIKPLYHPVGLIAVNPEGLPERLLKYLPRYPTLSAWQAESNV